jgi:hypothetical protein
MLEIRTKLLASLAAALLMAGAGHAQVVAKPVASGGASQFTLQVPFTFQGMPTIPAAFHWTLVDDFQEEFNGINIASGFYNNNSTGPRTELYLMRNQDAEGLGVVFSSCTIRAHMAVNGIGPKTAFLVVKQGGVQNDGPAISVLNNVALEYQRVMAVNPISGQPWTSDDLAFGTVAAGVKNDASPSGIGVGIADIILECN